MKELADPAFITALATLITAVTALIKVFHVDRTAKENKRVLQDVRQQTNGLVQEKRQQVEALQARVRILEDSGYVGRE